MKFFLSLILFVVILSDCEIVFAASDHPTVDVDILDRYAEIPAMCLAPMDFGYCKAKVKRYYFDTRRMKCSVFYWGGCAGNTNNFKSVEECNKYCLEDFVN